MWSPAQAEAVREVLREAGVQAALQEQADAPAVRVRVPAGQTERAHRVLAAQMTRVARAADGTAAGPGPSSQRPSEPDPPLVMERFRTWGAGLALVVAVSFVVVEIPGPTSLPVLLLAMAFVGGLIMVLRSRDD